jgi:hypothetical protein
LKECQIFELCFLAQFLFKKELQFQEILNRCGKIWDFKNLGNSKKVITVEYLLRSWQWALYSISSVLTAILWNTNWLLSLTYTSWHWDSETLIICPRFKTIKCQRQDLNWVFKSPVFFSLHSLVSYFSLRMSLFLFL